MWHTSWGKVKNWPAGHILIGYRYALVKYSYPSKKDFSFEKLAKNLPPKPLLGEQLETEEQLEYLRHLPYPKWFLKGGNVTIPILEKKVNIRIKDILPFAVQRIRAFIRSQMKTNWRSDSNRESINKLGSHEIEHLINELRMIDHIPLSVPIYGEDGIYMLYTAGWLTNRKNETEITLRFVDGNHPIMLHYRTQMNRLGYSFGTPHVSGDVGIASNGTPRINSGKVSWENFGVSFDSEKGGGTLVDGDFYAAGHLNEWIGYNLYW